MAHPPGRGHRRVQPDRHDARRAGHRDAHPRRRGTAVRRRRALHRPQRSRLPRSRRRLLRVLTVQVPWAALRSVVGKRDVLAELRPDKLLPATDRVPERFELGTLPYELMAGTTAAIDFLAGMTRATGSRRDRLAAAMAALDHHEDTLRQADRGRPAAAPRGHHPLPRGAPDADVACHSCRPRGCDQRRARTARHQCACRFLLRLRGLPRARLGRGGRCPDRPGALQRRRRRRPPPSRARRPWMGP